MDSSNSQLTSLQRKVLAALAGKPTEFFLTGGAVLAGWVLRHRHTDDLDFFTTSALAMSDVDLLIQEIAASVGATVESTRRHPDFRRCVFRVGEESLKVDFALDRAPQLAKKVVRDGVVTDSVEEIVANKICALIGRSEIRDLVDLYCLDKAGYRPDDFLDSASEKDAGVTPATVAWILSTFPIGGKIPGGISESDLRAFATAFEKRMRDRAKPGELAK